MFAITGTGQVGLEAMHDVLICNRVTPSLEQIVQRSIIFLDDTVEHVAVCGVSAMHPYYVTFVCLFVLLLLLLLLLLSSMPQFLTDYLQVHSKQYFVSFAQRLFVMQNWLQMKLNVHCNDTSIQLYVRI